MKNIILAFVLILLTSSSLLQNDSDDFNFILKYGIGAKNVVNTFDNEYTKDLILDGTVITKLTLTKEEKEQILNDMIKINIFDYPDKYTPPYKDNPDPDIDYRVSPHGTYYFKIYYKGKTKEINWDNTNNSKAEKAIKLLELIWKIDDIIRTKDEYKKLPEPNGEYL